MTFTDSADKGTRKQRGGKVSFCWQEGLSPVLSSVALGKLLHWEIKSTSFWFWPLRQLHCACAFPRGLARWPSPASYRPPPPPWSLQPAPHGEAFTVTPAQLEHRLPFSSLVCNKRDLVLSSSLTLKQHRGWRMPDPLSSTSRAMGLFVKTSSLFLPGLQWSCPGESFVHSLWKKPTVWS